ncbi:MAG TPA: acetylxylan esterase [Bryobacteraceae bacterium]|nr:acetylxylan esterase [Bryobacteraceae bacterium]
MDSEHTGGPMHRFGRLLAAITLTLPLFAQSEVPQVRAILSNEILPEQTAALQFREYLLTRVAAPPAVTDAKAWDAEREKIRRHMLDDVIYHGWPREWVEAAPRFEEAGVINGKGYRIRKLRYEIVPGFFSTALLYEPEHPVPNSPAILHVNGHELKNGKAAEYKQKRCINFARNGVIGLSLEWIGCGEMQQPGNEHWYAGHLDLAGRSGVGIFYLAMRKGLDYLYGLPGVDRNRIGMTGLSGGGWQTIVLSALDPRIRATAPVAGFSSIAARVEVHQYGDVGDPEQSASDMFNGYDFTHLVAMLPPRPALFAYNAEDDCCFRAPAVKPLVYDAMKPVFEKFGAAEAFDWHENRDPGTHNYQLDNRLAAYRFFSRQFHLPLITSETGVDEEVKSNEELAVGLPKDNLTLLGLARRTPRAAAGSAAGRDRLVEVVRYRAVAPARIWTTGITKNHGVESKSHLFRMNNGLSATAVWMKAITAPSDAPATIVLADAGKGAAAELISDRINRGEQVLAFDATFMGEAWQKSGAWEYEEILNGLGDRPLGIEAAQLIAAARWLSSASGKRPAAIETLGPRSQTIALVAAAIKPALFRGVNARDGVRSLSYLLEKPVEYSAAHDLFCLDLLKEFDLDRLAELARPK